MLPESKELLFCMQTIPFFLVDPQHRALPRISGCKLIFNISKTGHSTYPIRQITAPQRPSFSLAQQTRSEQTSLSASLSRASEMPSQSTLSSDDKNKVKSAVPVSSFKIHTATLARIYFAYPEPSRWSYGGLQGALAFVHDKQKNIFSVKMVDLAGTRGIIWEHELYEGFEYFSDRPYFQTFEGDVSQVGLCIQKYCTDFGGRRNV